MAIGIIEWSTASAERRAQLLTRNGTLEGLRGTQDLVASIESLLADVSERGDAALLDALAKFDKVDTGRIKVEQDEFDAAEATITPELSAAIDQAIERISFFNQEIVRRADWTVQTPDGGVLGEVVRPIESVGLFVPSGKGSFPSVLIQIGVPAKVAGVPDIQVVVPPAPGTNGAVDPATLVVAARLGFKDVYRVNGPSGIGALATGTETIRRVGKIVGPGSVPVAIAQQLVQRSGCSVVPGLGPTDSLIISDEHSDIDMIAADVVNEAEHGPDSSAVLVSMSRPLLEKVAVAIEGQLASLPEPRRSYARASIEGNGGLVLADTWDQCLEVANDYASEHVQLAVADPRTALQGVKYAGTALLGQWTTFAASNFVIGTPATLPTTGYAKYVSGVTAHTYLNRISTAEIGEEEFWSVAHSIKTLARHEGFPAHEASVLVREHVKERR